MSQATVKIRDVWKSTGHVEHTAVSSIQISSVTTYPGDKGEEQPAPEPQHTQEPLNECLLHGRISIRGEMAL